MTRQKPIINWLIGFYFFLSSKRYPLRNRRFLITGDFITGVRLNSVDDNGVRTRERRVEMSRGNMSILRIY